MPHHLFSHIVRHDHDVVVARQRAAYIAALLGFDVSEQTRIATATSEIVRNAFRYAGGGTVDFGVDGAPGAQRLVIQVSDRGRGIPHLDDVLAGRFRSATGMGIGISSARRLIDGFRITSSPAGTTAVLEKILPARAEVVSSERARDVAEAARERAPGGLAEEVQLQNQELLRALEALERKQEELVELNRELEDTNRGVVALYAELDQKAEHLRHADELRSKFLSNMTHEFRTPVNSIVGLCNLLIEDAGKDGIGPSPELLYIRKAAEQLSELVDDALDMAKVEAGRIVVRPSAFEVAKLFGALRGMLRPMLVNPSVTLIVEDVSGLPVLRTDEAKVSQILRNLITNALKFTERGEVRVSARLDGTDHIVFDVSDTGIGIAPEDQSRIFDEFAQVEHRLQRANPGTGLGLPLSRRLAGLLGGALSVVSEPGVGSTFSVTLPVEYRGESAGPRVPAAPDERVEPRLAAATFDRPIRVLLVDDEEASRYLLRACLPAPEFDVTETDNGSEALRRAAWERPDVVLLDLLMPDMNGFEVLDRLRANADTSSIPVVIATSNELSADTLRQLRAGASTVLSKSRITAGTLGEAVHAALTRGKERSTDGQGPEQQHPH